MTAPQIERLLKLLIKFNVSSFECKGVKVAFGEIKGTTVAPSPSKIPSKARETSISPIPVSEVDIPHQVDKVRQLLRLSDTELVDKLFPEPPQGNSV